MGTFHSLFALFLETALVSTHPLDALEMLLRQCRIMGLSNAGTPARFVGFWVRGSARQTCVLASSILSKAHGKQWGSPLLSGDLGKSPLCVFVSSSVKWINNRTYGRIQGLWGLKLKKKYNIMNMKLGVGL